MNHDGGVEDTKQSLATGRTHTEIMRSLGYDPPEPEQKKPKTVWQQMIENFPCPPEQQHAMWAARIIRNFRIDCGFPRNDWGCDCDKCSRGIDGELAESYSHLHASENGEFTLPMDGACCKEWVQGCSPTAVRDLREISAGVDEFSIPCERIPLVNTQTVGPGVNFIHLFLREQQARQNQGPETPFTTAILGDIEEVNAFAPRVMWLRARTIDPTYLSFRQVVY